MSRRRVLGIAAAIAVIATIVAVSVVLTSAGRPTPTGPSIVVILSDDQRWNTLPQMPNVERLLVRHGVDFANGFVVNSLCCPSRVSILTGQYSHSTGVYTDSLPDGGFQKFHDSSTLATWLHDAGYRTGLIGKYLNEYRGTYVPPGWDRWFSFQQNPHGYYYDYSVNDGGTIRHYGTAPAAYSTDVLTRQAVSFIHEERGPLFLYFSPYAPHAPSTAAPRDVHAFRTLPRFDPPSLDERDMSDKPAWMRSLPMTPRRTIDEYRRAQYRSALDLDRAVAAIVEALRQTGRLHHTMIVYLTDNGIAWGEHRWLRKEVPYEESIRVPYVIRYDPLTRGPRVDRHLVLNIDLAQTIAGLAGVGDPGAEGQSLVPLLARRPTRWRRDFLIEHVQGEQRPDPPTFCAIRTERYLYVVYATREVELYDLRRDPFELANAAGEPSMVAVARGLRRRLTQLCTPRPPGLNAL
jgi:arylsulfatase A-like enzyme